MHMSQGWQLAIIQPPTSFSLMALHLVRTLQSTHEFISESSGI